MVSTSDTPSARPEKARVDCLGPAHHAVAEQQAAETDLFRNVAAWHSVAFTLDH